MNSANKYLETELTTHDPETPVVRELKPRHDAPPQEPVARQARTIGEISAFRGRKGREGQSQREQDAAVNSRPAAGIQEMTARFEAAAAAAAADHERVVGELTEQLDGVRHAPAEARRERRWAADVCAIAREERDSFRARVDELTRERDHLRERVNVDERQLRRLRIADRHRVAEVVERFAAKAIANAWRVGVMGAGAHTEWLFRETPLQTIPDLFVFDSDPAMHGRLVGGVTVRPAADIAVMHLQAVVASSLAFQDEMAGYIESLDLGVEILRCYP